MKKYKFLSERKSFKTTESYKALRTNLVLCGDDVKVVTVTSCSPGDGKSYVAQNLALSLAQDNKRTLLIDADLRKSATMGKVSTKEDIVGFSAFMAGQVDFEQIVYQNEDMPNLFTVFTGTFPPNPAELLGSDKFKNMITKVRELFDYVIIDTPPLGSVIDSAIISTVSDGAIMVVRSGKTSYRFARGVKAQLEKTGCRILGAVLNGVDVDNKDKYYYRNYKNYYYSDYSKYY